MKVNADEVMQDLQIVALICLMMCAVSVILGRGTSFCFIFLKQQYNVQCRGSHIMFSKTSWETEDVE